jgi:hypothetical protein
MRQMLVNHVYGRNTNTATFVNCSQLVLGRSGRTYFWYA